MRIAILGTGALASVFGAFLGRNGNDVLLIGREAGIASVRDSGLRVTAGVEELMITVATATLGSDMDAVVPVDVLLVCTKALNTPGQLRGLRGLHTTAAASLQNGIAKDDFLAAAFGKEKVLGAATLVSAESRADGSVAMVNRAPTLLAGGDAAASLAAALQDAGLPAAVVPRREVLLWSKAAFSAAGFGVSALTRLDVGGILGNAELRSLFLDLFREVAAVAGAHGIRLEDYQGLPARSYAELPRSEALAMLADMGERVRMAPVPLRVSMLQDLEAGRPPEVEEVVGPLVEAARESGVTTPLLDTTYRVLSGLVGIHSSDTCSPMP